MRKPVVIRERPYTTDELAKIFRIPKRRLQEIKAMAREAYAEELAEIAAAKAASTVAPKKATRTTAKRRSTR